MNHRSPSSDAYIQAIAINLTALRDRLRDALVRADAASEACGTDEVEIAMGALCGMEMLLIEAHALHQAALILHRSHYAANRAHPSPTPSTPAARRPSDVESAHLEVDELATLGVLTDERALLLKSRLTAEVVAQHLNAGLSISEIVDLYNDVAAMESTSTEKVATEAALCAEFERYCAEQSLGERDDAIALLHRQNLTDEQRRWLSDFVRRWDAMRKRSSAPGG